MMGGMRFVIGIIAAAGCGASHVEHATAAQLDPPAAPPAPVQTKSAYETARASFTTLLLRGTPAPQRFAPVRPPAGAREIEVESGPHRLKAWISSTAAARAPAVLFLHGGFAFAEDDWDMAKPFRDAGFIVMAPILRGENGQTGSFTLFYDEVDDVLAAVEVLAKQPSVDAARIYVTGHSAGGVLTMFAAMSSHRFRAAASLSGTPDATVFAGEPAMIPFDPSSADEFRMRSPQAFATSFKCPTRLYFGEEEDHIADSTRATARAAKEAKLDVEAIAVPGDHQSMVVGAIPLAVELFQKQR
jgi:dipeptidyl aminopeptidase/acylaminoacyl peptidase